MLHWGPPNGSRCTVGFLTVSPNQHLLPVPDGDWWAHRDNYVQSSGVYSFVIMSVFHSRDVLRMDLILASGCRDWDWSSVSVALQYLTAAFLLLLQMLKRYWPHGPHGPHFTLQTVCESVHQTVVLGHEVHISLTLVQLAHSLGCSGWAISQTHCLSAGPPSGM